MDESVACCFKVSKPLDFFHHFKTGEGRRGAHDMLHIPPAGKLPTTMIQEIRQDFQMSQITLGMGL